MLYRSLGREPTVKSDNNHSSLTFFVFCNAVSTKNTETPKMRPVCMLCGVAAGVRVCTCDVRFCVCNYSPNAVLSDLVLRRFYTYHFSTQN